MKIKRFFFHPLYLGLLTLIFNLFIVDSVNAIPRWALVEQKNGGKRIFVDQNSKNQVGNMLVVWILEDYKTGQQDYTKRWYSVTSKNIFDCPSRVYRRIHTSAYNGSMGVGQIVRNRLLNTRWVPVKSGRLFSAICSDFKKAG